MRITFLVLLFLGFGIFTAMVTAETNPNALAFPELELRSFEFGELGECDGIVDCTAFIGRAIANVGKALIAVVSNILILMFFIVQVVAIVSINSVTGFAGAPPWFNAIIATIFGVTIGIGAYRMIRVGDVE